MQWIKMPEIEPDTERAHWFGYCWSCQRDEFQPGKLLCTQRYLNPFIHTEPICEGCARRCDPDFGKGAILEMIDGGVHITIGDEPQCPHVHDPETTVWYHQIWLSSSRRTILACSRECAKQVATKLDAEWVTLCENIGMP